MFHSTLSLALALPIILCWNPFCVNGTQTFHAYHSICLFLFARSHAINRWCICSFVSIIFPIWNPNLITFAFHKHRLHRVLAWIFLWLFGILPSSNNDACVTTYWVCVCVCESTKACRIRTNSTMQCIETLMTFSWNVQTTVNPIDHDFPPTPVILHAIGQFTNHIDNLII